MKAGPKAAVDDSRLPLRTRSADSARLAAFCERFIRVPRGTGALGPLRPRPWQPHRRTRRPEDHRDGHRRRVRPQRFGRATHTVRRASGVPTTAPNGYSGVVPQFTLPAGGSLIAEGNAHVEFDAVSPDSVVIGRSGAWSDLTAGGMPPAMSHLHRRQRVPVGSCCARSASGSWKLPLCALSPMDRPSARVAGVRGLSGSLSGRR